MVVTGLGVVTPLGNDLATFWQRLIAGECGIDRITAFDATGFETQIAGQVKDLDLTPAFPSPKEIRRTDRFSQYGVHAGWQALQDSGADLDKLNRDDIGVILGSGIGGLETTTAQVKVLLERGPGRLSPFMIPMLIGNMASGLFSMYNRLRGPNFATCSACATANHAIGEAWRTIKMGEAVMMFAGGCEAAIVPIGIGGFCAMRAMSTRNDDPKRSSRPFDKQRDGFVMGEGAGVLALEELAHARKRGAKIYCEIVGYGNTADAHHLTAPAPDGEGARLYGGRWNRKGIPMVYTAGSQSLAMLEMLVQDEPLRAHYMMIPATLPDTLVIEHIDATRLPADWRALPAPESLQAMGTEWARLKNSAVLAVPSAVIPAETNYMLNPVHPAFGEIEIGIAQPFITDLRLIKG